MTFKTKIIIWTILIVILLPLAAALYSPTLTRTLFDQYARMTTMFKNAVRKAALLTDTDCYDEHIRQACLTHEVDRLLIKAIIKTESGFDPTAESAKGARGLMQLMPATALDMDVSDPDDPGQNIFGGTRYLAWLLKKFDHNLELALAAYNAGPQNVKKYKGIPPFQETEQFVQRVLKQYARYKKDASSQERALY